MKNDKLPVGGGVKKILYALQTIKRIGLLDSKKALTTNQRECQNWLKARN